MSEKFTRGPWKATYDSQLQALIEIYSTEDRTIVAVLPDRGTTEAMSEIEANANLIAAAPDMYEALRKISLQLEEMRPMLSDTHAYMRNEMIADIKNLLRKARGEIE